MNNLKKSIFFEKIRKNVLTPTLYVVKYNQRLGKARRVPKKILSANVPKQGKKF